MHERDREPRGHNRQRFTATTTALGVSTLAGCTGGSNEETETTTESSASGSVGQIGSGRSPSGDRGITGGVSVTEMSDLSGELTLYSGRGQTLVGESITFSKKYYDDFTIRPRYNSAAELVDQIQTGEQNNPADVFFSINAGLLGALKDVGRTQNLPSEVLDLVRDEFHNPDGQWTGTSGRARTAPLNTDQFDESGIPDDIMAFPDAEAFRDNIGWAPTYSLFQAFITAMRVLEDEDATREWLQGMQDPGVTEYNDELLVSQAVADGEIAAGFANHHYIQCILAGRPSAPLSTAFTAGDAGSIFNVADALVLNTADDAELTSNFVRHLLSAEARDYFAWTTFEYPLVSGVDPIGELPSIDELNPPGDLDLTQLSDLEGTVELLREVGVL